MSLKTRLFVSALILSCGATSLPAHAQDRNNATPSLFQVALNDFTNCLKHVVQMGMTVKMEPTKFRDGLEKSCKPEEARFRAEGIKEAVRQSRTEAEAIAEIDGNIANGRRIFAADQESYVRTGRVPR